MADHYTSEPRRPDNWSRLLWIIIILAPLFVLFFLPGGPLLPVGIWFWLALVVCIVVLFTVLRAPRAGEELALEPEGPRMVPPEEQPEVVREVMNVRLAEEERGTWVFRGRLRLPAPVAFERLKTALGDEVVPLLQPDERAGAAIILVPHRIERARLERPVRPWLHWLLFGLTFLTTTWAGAAHQGVDLLREPGRFAVGLPYSLALLAILGVHEMGHYLAARHHGMNVTPPYFVPVPFALGTFGAFIQMRSPSENRRSLFDVAVAGPLAGLAVAIPALLIGLRSSQVLAPEMAAGLARDPSVVVRGASAGSSMLLALMAKLSLGDQLYQGCMLQLGPMAFAGWLGLFITALNLLPVGQLDGGHIARATFGTRAGLVISSIAMWSLVLLGLFVWKGLLTWAIIVYFIAGRGTPPLNDITPLNPWRRWLGFFTFAVLAAILVPVPHGLLDKLGIYCPYM